MMDVTKVSTVRCIMVMVILWPVGCSIFQPAGQEKVPPETPVPLATKQALDSPQDARPLPPPEEKYLKHKIKWPGENLILIARWYTGSAKNWIRLVEANPGIEPKRINFNPRRPLENPATHANRVPAFCDLPPKTASVTIGKKGR
jgi:hypothetical protein